MSEDLDYEDFDMDPDDDEEDDDYDYTDVDDAHFDGFLKADAVIDPDIIHDQIMNYLRLGIDPKQSEKLAGELHKMVKDGYALPVSDGVVEFVCECPPSNIELVQRLQSIQSLLKMWTDCTEHLTGALNRILDGEKPALNRIPARNLSNFIRVLVDEKYIDKSKLLIAESCETSLTEPYLERLQQVLYNHYGRGNPMRSKMKFGPFENMFNLASGDNKPSMASKSDSNVLSQSTVSSSQSAIPPSSIKDNNTQDAAGTPPSDPTSSNTSSTTTPLSSSGILQKFASAMGNPFK